MSDETFSELSQYQVDPNTADLLELTYCQGNRVVVLGPLPSDRMAGLTVGMLDPGDERLLEELEQKLGRPVIPVQLNDFEIRRSLSQIYENQDIALTAEIELLAGREITFGPDQSAPEMLLDLLSVAARLGATDVHIEIYKADVDLRFRIDTVLQQVTTPLSPENVSKVVNRLKIVAGLDPLERRHPQDGHLRARCVGWDSSERLIDLRVSTVPGRFGEDAVVRLLDPNSFKLDLHALGFGEDTLARYERLVRYPSGLILVTGPTLSGKTNTLYATVKQLIERGVKVVTVEDPVEFEFPKVNQKGVNKDMGFADYVRAFLRQNPDVIVVGEVRDADTAETVVRAATTGHLVLSSVHTRDAVGAISRLRALGIDDDALASILIGVASQRLVRVICPACKAQTTPLPHLIDLYYAEPPTHPFYAGTGCAECHDTGYHGLTAIFELFQLGPALEAAISAGQPLDTLRAIAIEGGFRPVLLHGLEKVAAGITTLEEIARRIAPR